MALDMLQNLLGGGQQRQDYQDFVNRYDQGHPSEGYTGQEVANRYQQVAPQLPPNVYQESAEQAFARLTPEERAEFARWLQTRAQQQNVTVPGLNQMTGGQPPDPGALARMTTQMQQQQPDILSQLLGGHSGTILDNPLAKAAVAGIAAMAVRRVLTGR
jgi:hypothetical protein